MTPNFRRAVRADVPAMVALLSDDVLGEGREGEDLAPYLAAFDAIGDHPHNALFVGGTGGETGADADLAAETRAGEGEIIALYQLTIIQGLSRGGAARALVEGVRVAAAFRGRGVGALLMADAEARAREAGCVLIQLTTDRTRTRAHAFYDRLGYKASHIGYKRMLDS